MHDTIEIREATEGDLDALTALNIEVQMLHVNAMPYRFKVPDPDAIQATFAEWFVGEAFQIAIAHLDGQAAGYVVVRIRQVPEHAFCFEQRSLYIDHIGVAETFRGCGVGRRLIAWTKQMAVELKIDRVELDVWDFNVNARNFFAAQGFVPATHKLAMTV